MLRMIFGVIVLVAGSYSVYCQHPTDRFTHLLGFTLNEDSLSGIQRQLGPAKVIETGDAGDYEVKISYFFQEVGTVVMFKSGEMGGGKELLEFELETSKVADTALWSAPRIKLKSSSQLSVGGLMLGMNQEAFVKQIGTRPVWHKDTAQIEIWYHHKLTPNEYKVLKKKLSPEEPASEYEVCVAIKGIFKSGRLARLAVSRSQTT